MRGTPAPPDRGSREPPVRRRGGKQAAQERGDSATTSEGQPKPEALPIDWSTEPTPAAANGEWTWDAIATDARGNTGRAGSILIVVGC